MTACETLPELASTLAHAADALGLARQIQASLAGFAAPGYRWPCV